MKTAAALTALAMASLPACASPPTPMVGGPCSYEFKTVTASVLRVLDGDIELQDEDGVTFYIEADRFDAPPEVQQRYRFQKRYITQGSCTPFGFQLIGPAEAPMPSDGAE